MFRLPVCPHCGTVYRYRDTKKAFQQKENTCYHCKKSFRARLLPYVFVETIILLPLCIGLNILMLYRMTRLNLIALFAVTVGFLILGYLLSPFFIHFQKSEKTPENRRKTQRKQNNHSIKQSNSSKNQQQSNKKRRS